MNMTSAKNTIKHFLADDGNYDSSHKRQGIGIILAHDYNKSKH